MSSIISSDIIEKEKRALLFKRPKILYEFLDIEGKKYLLTLRGRKVELWEVGAGFTRFIDDEGNTYHILKRRTKYFLNSDKALQYYNFLLKEHKKEKI